MLEFYKKDGYVISVVEMEIFYLSIYFLLVWSGSVNSKLGNRKIYTFSSSIF